MNVFIKAGLVSFVAAFTALPVFAQDVPADTTPSINRRLPTRKEARVFALKREKVTMGSAKVTAVDGSTLTVDKGGKSYTVLTGAFAKCTTRFVRHYGGKSSISEVAVGNIVNVIGAWQDEAKTTVEACLVRNQSIQKRFGTFTGTIQSVTDTGFVMTTARDPRKNQTVTISASTKLVDRKGKAITQADILAGHKVLVRGVWDRQNNTVTEVTEVKDYNLPQSTSK